MENQRLDFCIVETGGMIMVAAAGKGDSSPTELGEIIRLHGSSHLIEHAKGMVMEF